MELILILFPGIIAIITSALMSKKWEKHEKVDKGIELCYWKLSYRRKLIRTLWTVSYTHLDVYKRQSVYNEAYQKFRTETFELEEPYRNFLMQPASRNPVYQRFMGVKYLISQEEIPGYEKMGIVGNTKILQNDRVSPIAYATNRLLNQKTYETLRCV